MNQQLIAYYFGGKQGLYEELTREWAERERGIAPAGAPFGEVIAGYISETLAHPDWAKLLIRRALDGELEPDGGVAHAVADIERRQAAGELTDEFDAGFILAVSTAVAVAPVALPHMVQVAVGELADERAVARFSDQARRLFAPRGTAGDAAVDPPIRRPAATKERIH